MFSDFKAVKKVIYGADPFGERLLGCIALYADIFSSRVFHNRTSFSKKLRTSIVRKRFRHDEDSSYHIRDVRLPLLENELESSFFAYTFEDIYYSYCYIGDKYSEKIYDRCDKFLSEGLYGLVNDKVNVTVEPGDVVFDIGSWIGDFAAYASRRGARVYAFEPSGKIFAEELSKTAEMNPGIIAVNKALGSETQSSNDVNKGVFGADISEIFEVSTLDDFVNENNLERVDFIKCDIEGNERYMLAGAQETLSKFAPKLALCTYHLPDDPEVMRDLILQANPKYNIVQKNKKLFASVQA